ncbi:MAG: TauD/TfdA family dioxygenase [Rhodospirillaceae bacterium]
MTIKINQLHPCFVAEFADVDLSKPIDDATFKEIVEGMDRHAVGVFHGPTLTEEQHADYAERFGPLDPNNGILSTGLKRRISPRLADIANLDHENEKFAKDSRRRMFNLGNQLWHTDSTFKKIPAMYSLLHAHSVAPEGGETQFCDMRAAYDALSQKMKDRIENLVAEHSIFTSRMKLGFTEFSEEERALHPPTRRGLVRVHPGSGRKGLYLASHASHIYGMPVADGKMLLMDLMEHATQREFVHTHHWKVGDLVIWDNRCTMHRARPFDDLAFKRDMRRATVQDLNYPEITVADEKVA